MVLMNFTQHWEPASSESSNEPTELFYTISKHSVSDHQLIRVGINLLMPRLARVNSSIVQLSERHDRLKPARSGWRLDSPPSLPKQGTFAL